MGRGLITSYKESGAFGGGHRMFGISEEQEHIFGTMGSGSWKERQEQGGH